MRSWVAVSTLDSGTPDTPDSFDAPQATASLGDPAPGAGAKHARSGGRFGKYRLRSPGRRHHHLIKRTWLRRTVAVGLTVAVVGATLTVAELAFIQHEWDKRTVIVVHNLAPKVTTGPHANAETILMIGSTTRCGLTTQNQIFGVCAQGVTGVNSDVMLILHTDPELHKVSILSLPRDLVLYNVRQDNFHKLDAGLAASPSQLVLAVEQDLGIPINHFVELNFDTFQSLVNTLGGVKVDFPDEVYDESSELKLVATSPPGCHLLNGFEALALVRARHMYYKQDGVWDYDGSGDLGRIVRTHEFLRLLASQVAQRGLGNPITDNDLIGDVAPDLVVDSTFTLSDMANLILDYHNININKASETTLPNIEDHVDYMYEGFDYGSIVLPSYPQDQQAIDQFLDLSTAPGGTVKPASFTVRVTDGYNDPATASSTQTKLKNLGYDVTGTGTWPSVGPLAETVIEYKPGYLLQAESLMNHFSGIVSLAQAPTTAVSGSDLPTSDGYDVTVITGSNFSISGASHASTGTPHSSGSGSSSSPTTSTTSTSTSTSTTLPGAGAPSSSTSALGPASSAKDPTPSYDPRACTPNQPVING
jgi:LCP family protein required for cell wall assembly